MPPFDPIGSDLGGPEKLAGGLFEVPVGEETARQVQPRGEKSGVDPQGRPVMVHGPVGVVGNVGQDAKAVMGRGKVAVQPTGSFEVFSCAG
jgi:hypothetical protein